jgi:hypothetical protein
VLAIVFATCITRFGELLDKALHDPWSTITRPHKVLIAKQLVAQ